MSLEEKEFCSTCKLKNNNADRHRDCAPVRRIECGDRSALCRSTVATYSPLQGLSRAYAIDSDRLGGPVEERERMR